MIVVTISDARAVFDPEDGSWSGTPRLVRLLERTTDDIESMLGPQDGDPMAHVVLQLRRLGYTVEDRRPPGDSRLAGDVQMGGPQ